MKAAIVAAAAVGQMALFGPVVAADVPTTPEQITAPDLRAAARQRVLSGVAKSAEQYLNGEGAHKAPLPSVAQLLEQSRQLDAVGDEEDIGLTDTRVPFTEKDFDDIREQLLVGSLKSLLDNRCAILTRVEIVQWIFSPIDTEPHTSESFSFEDCCYSMGLIAEEMQEGLRFVLRKDPAYQLAMSPDVIRAFARDLAVREAQRSLIL